MSDHSAPIERLVAACDRLTAERDAALARAEAAEARALRAEAAGAALRWAMQPLIVEPRLEWIGEGDERRLITALTLTRARELFADADPGAPLLDALRMCADWIAWQPHQVCCTFNVTPNQCGCGRDTALAAIRRVLGGAP